MRLLLIILILGGGGYLAVQKLTYTEPLPEMVELPPPPPPSKPPPRLTPEQYRKMRIRLFHTDPRRRVKVTEGLRKFVGPEADALLELQLKTDTNHGNRSHAINILRDRAEPTAPAIILPALHDTHPNVRMTALLALRDLDARQFVSSISQKLFDTDPAIRRATILTFRHFQETATRKKRKKEYRLPEEYQRVYQKALAHARAGAIRTPAKVYTSTNSPRGSR